MKKPLPLGAACILVMMLVTAPAHSATVTVQYQGVVSSSVSGGFGVPLSTSVSGSLVYSTQGVADDTSPAPLLAVYNNPIQSFSLTIAQPIGDPSASIAGPLDISASTVEIDNGNVVDQYTFNFTISNGPTLAWTQANGFVQTRTLTQVRLNSAQNSNPISSTDLDENLFSAFQPGSGTQPQRIVVGVTNHSGVYVGDLYMIDFEPTSIAVSSVPVPAAVWLFGSGLVGLVGIARRKKLVC